MTDVNKKFGTNAKPYPAEMRTQNWPLCCGAKIISGFKSVGNIADDELVKQIADICDNHTPDHQIYSGETINPKLTFLTLNSGQVASPKIMTAIKEAGFKLFLEAAPRGPKQSFFYRDLSNTVKLVVPAKEAVAA